MPKSFIIAVDGPAASGKGTLAKNLASALEMDYLDTGLLYRAVGKKIKDAGGDPSVEAIALPIAKSLTAKDLEDPNLRGEEIASYASICSGIASVRSTLLQYQTDFANNPPMGKKGAILDGRDIGSVVCPDAQVKLFITASCFERANRRYKEAVSKGQKDVSWQEIYDAIYARDERERTRSSSPVVAAPDAIVIDSSFLSIDQVQQLALSEVHAAVRALRKRGQVEVSTGTINQATSEPNGSTSGAQCATSTESPVNKSSFMSRRP